MSAIFLTSTGLSNSKVCEAFLNEAGVARDKAVVIITTAADAKEQDEYCQLAFQQFKNLEYQKIDFIDLEKTPDYDFSKYDIIYVSGGNTFRLLKFAKAANFKTAIENLLNRGGIYIGVSAGSYIMCPSIEMAEWKPDPDRNYFGLIDFSGFNFVPFLLVVHYKPEYFEIIKNNIASSKYLVRLLTDEQAFLIKDNQIKLVGEGEEIILNNLKSADTKQILQDWFSLQLKLWNKENKVIFKEGELWWCSLGVNLGEEILGKGDKFTRPILIFKKLTSHSFLGLPLTSQEKIGTWYVEIRQGGKISWIMLNQARILDKKRLTNRIGTVDDADFKKAKQRFLDFYGC